MRLRSSGRRGPHFDQRHQAQEDPEEVLAFESKGWQKGYGKNYKGKGPMKGEPKGKGKSSKKKKDAGKGLGKKGATVASNEAVAGGKAVANDGGEAGKGAKRGKGRVDDRDKSMVACRHYFAGRCLKGSECQYNQTPSCCPSSDST